MSSQLGQAQLGQLQLGGLNQVAIPVLIPNGGTWIGGVSVTITCATVGATIRYTLDGSTPSEFHGVVYSGPVSLITNVTLKSIAYKFAMSDSVVVSAIFVVSTKNFIQTGAGGAMPLPLAGVSNTRFRPSRNPQFRSFRRTRT